MKLEMGESLLYSWLKHVKNCQIVQTNWKPSKTLPLLHEDELTNIINKTENHFLKYKYNLYKQNASVLQILQQAEIDLIGMRSRHGSVENVYAVDVAYHEAGLNYGSKNVTIATVIKKCIRSAICLYGYFDIKKADILFASPKIGNNILSPLQECLTEAQNILSGLGYDFRFTLYSGNLFKQEILDPVLNQPNIVDDTNELFARSAQLIQMCSKILPETTEPASQDDDAPLPTFPIDIKVGELARRMIPKLIDEGKVSTHEIDKMLTLEYSKENFGLKYPVLAKTDAGYPTKRYYSENSILIQINSVSYVLCNDWYENKNRALLENWIKARDFDNVYV